MIYAPHPSVDEYVSIVYSSYPNILINWLEFVGVAMAMMESHCYCGHDYDWMCQIDDRRNATPLDRDSGGD